MELCDQRTLGPLTYSDYLSISWVCYPTVYETDLDVFDISWNSDRNRTDAIQTMVRTLLTIAGFSVLYRIVW